MSHWDINIFTTKVLLDSIIDEPLTLPTELFGIPELIKDILKMVGCCMHVWSHTGTFVPLPLFRNTLEKLDPFPHLKIKGKQIH